MFCSLSRGPAAIAGLVLAIGFTTAAEEDGIKAVTAAGGKVTYDKVGKKKGVGGVVLAGPKVTDEVMKKLLEFPGLNRVEIKNTPKLTADGVSELGKVKQLRAVELAGPLISDAVAKSLSGATAITELNLSGGSLTDDGVKELAALTKLETLSITQNKKIKGTTVPSLVAVKGLKYLTINNCELGDLEGWGALKALSKLTSLGLAQTGVTDAGLKEIGKLTQLTILGLDGTPITDAGLADLKNLRSLDKLSLVDTKITDKAVPILSGMKKLSFLTLSEKQITKAGGEALKKALPNCDVNVMP
ncbi:MAG: hypothetical protein U0792_11275 [Gemmataceae bacterium]